MGEQCFVLDNWHPVKIGVCLDCWPKRRMAVPMDSKFLGICMCEERPKLGHRFQWWVCTCPRLPLFLATDKLCMDKIIPSGQSESEVRGGTRGTEQCTSEFH